MRKITVISKMEMEVDEDIADEIQGLNGLDIFHLGIQTGMITISNVDISMIDENGNELIGGPEDNKAIQESIESLREVRELN